MNTIYPRLFFQIYPNFGTKFPKVGTIVIFVILRFVFVLVCPTWDLQFVYYIINKILSIQYLFVFNLCYSFIHLNLLNNPQNRLVWASTAFTKVQGLNWTKQESLNRLHVAQRNGDGPEHHVARSTIRPTNSFFTRLIQFSILIQFMIQSPILKLS